MWTTLHYATAVPSVSAALIRGQCRGLAVVCSSIPWSISCHFRVPFFKWSFLCLCGKIFCLKNYVTKMWGFENFFWRVHTFVRSFLMWFRNLWLGNKFLCTFWYLTIRTCIFSSVIDIFGQNLSITFGNLCLPQQARIGQWATGWKIEGFGRSSCGHNQRSMSRG